MKPLGCKKICCTFGKITIPMKQFTNRFAAVLWLLVCTHLVHAQLVLKKDGPLHDAVEKVLTALPGQLKTVTGAMIADNPQSREYESKVLLPGSISSSVVQYASVDNKKTIAAWHATVMETDEFATASKKFKWLYNQIKSASYNCGGKSIRLTAKYEAPKEEITFTTLVFEQPGDKGNERLQLSMNYEITNWVIRISVYNEDREVASLIKNGPQEKDDD
jgi:hypothetical protein